jgi:peptidoglycan/LPS O-acetylase OafA/YrhL
VYLHLFRPATTVLQSFIGFFPRADLYADINSPLWYFTFILGYYLIFPLIFFKRFPVISSCIMLVISYVITQAPLPIGPGVLGLYRLHYLAFPLGMLFAAGTELLLAHQTKLAYFWKKIPQIPPILITLLRLLGIMACTYAIGYFLINSGVGKSVRLEEIISVVTTGIVIVLALLLKASNRCVLLFGTYSYEIYLLHWPFFYRYSPLFALLPPAAALDISLGLLLIFAWMLQKVTALIVTYLAPEFSKK